MELMDKYADLEEKYCGVVTREDVNESDEVISLNTLYNSLYCYFHEVNNIYNKSLGRIADSINNSDGTFLALKGFSNGKGSFNKTSLSYDEYNNTLSMYFYSDDCSPIIICKNMGEDNYYYASINRLNDKALELCSEEIEYSFKTVEDSISLFKKHGVFERLKNDKITQSFKTLDIDSEISYDSIGSVNLSMRFNSTLDPDNVQFDHFVGEGKKVSYLFYCTDVVRKKIPINISELDSLSQEIVFRYKKAKEKTYPE